MGKILEKPGSFVSPEKSEPWNTIKFMNDFDLMF